LKRYSLASRDFAKSVETLLLYKTNAQSGHEVDISPNVSAKLSWFNTLLKIGSECFFDSEIKNTAMESTIACGGCKSDLNKTAVPLES
jgi:hypothetical protein